MPELNQTHWSPACIQFNQREITSEVPTWVSPISSKHVPKPVTTPNRPSKFIVHLPNLHNITKLHNFSEGSALSSDSVLRAATAWSFDWERDISPPESSKSRALEDVSPVGVPSSPAGHQYSSAKRACSFDPG
ncbi:hypothetical protein T265_07597 [Opisthorchis viverrini]|uniref:Uncharacterized protein n=1 Tax=Opisthorchis viverrini TaxID=6198 RepID=A0A074ZGM6_OPIVI|nr:hypothetical protein T265_07597 [Opisthorchis viverrini]KER24812.1 hypothetical protein T265_07597 [Opisthorchis viverrini]